MTYHAARNEFLSRELLEFIERAVGQNYGLLTRVTYDEAAYRKVRLHFVQADLSSPVYFRDNAPQSFRTVSGGSGAGLTREKAYWSAIGEAVERYCASIYDESCLVNLPGENVQEAIDLTGQIRSSRPEVSPYDPHTPRLWAKGWKALDGSECFIPASMVYLGYKRRYPGEILSQNDSTGLACGRSLQDATLRAVSEIIERDAFAASWHLNRPPPEITFGGNGVSGAVPLLKPLVTHGGWAPRFFYIAKSFDLHVVAAYVADGTYCSVGSAASANINSAIEKAAVEVVQGWSAAGKWRAPAEPLTLANLTHPFHHSRYYMHPARSAILREYFAGAETVSFASLSNSCQIDVDAKDIAALMAASGLALSSVRLTTEDVEDLGLEVVRVLAPGLQPLTFGPTSPSVADDRRLQHWRHHWGLAQANYNPEPHPFP